MESFTQFMSSAFAKMKSPISKNFNVPKVLGMGLVLFIVLIVATNIIDQKLFPDRLGSPLYLALYVMKSVLIAFGMAGLVLMIRARRMSLPVVIALALYLFLFTQSVLEGSMSTGPIFAIAIVGIVGAGLVLSGTRATRMLLLLPTLILLASVIYYFFEPEKSFRFGWYSDYLGELPIGLLNGVVSHHNHFGPFMALAIIIIVATGSTPITSLLLAFAVIGLMWSGSDGSMAATVYALVAMIIERDLRERRRGRKAWRAMAAFVSGIALAIWSLVIALVAGVNEFTSGRAEVATAVIERGQDGLDEIAWLNSPHDAWLTLWLGAGPIGVGLAIALWLSLAISIYRSEPGPERTLAVGILVFLSVHGLVEVSWGRPGISLTTVLVALMTVSASARKKVLSRH